MNKLVSINDSVRIMADYIANDYTIESADQGLVILVSKHDRITLKRQIDGVLVTTQDIAK